MTIKGVFIALAVFFGVAAVGKFFASRPHVEIEPHATSVTADGLRGGCTKGSVFNVTGTVSEEHTSVTGEPMAELKTTDSEFTLRLGFARPETIFVGTRITVQGTCSVSEPGLLVVLRNSKLIK